jgi:DNA-binding response OmpR family regulator
VIDVVATWSDDPVVDVLLIAYDGALAEMYRMKLEMDGYRVTTVHHLDEWQVPPGGWRPDIVMVDLSAGGPRRLRDVQGFRSDHLYKDVPLLILSTESERELRERLPLSATDYVLRVSEPGDLSRH